MRHLDQPSPIDYINSVVMERFSLGKRKYILHGKVPLRIVFCTSQKLNGIEEGEYLRCQYWCLFIAIEQKNTWVQGIFPRHPVLGD
jgi:hypothetical protein